MSHICAVCGKKIPLFKIRIKDGFICGPCQDRMPLNDIKRKLELTGEEVRRIIEEGEKRDNAKPDLFQQAMMKIQRSNDPVEKVRQYKELCTYICSNGDKYEGQFVGNTFEGYGRMEKADGEVYEGEFLGNVYHGKGKLKHPNGEIDEAVFKAGFAQGPGTRRYTDGEVVKGVFENGRFSE